MMIMTIRGVDGKISQFPYDFRTKEQVIVALREKKVFLIGDSNPEIYFNPKNIISVAFNEEKYGL